MTPESAFYALCAVGLAIVFYGPWQSLMAEIGRQTIFRSRDRLFDMAADGKWCFDDPVYRDARDLLNGLARYCHKVTVPRMIMILFLHKLGRHDETYALPHKKIHNDKALRKAVRQQVMLALSATFIQAFLRSAFGLAFIGALLVAWLLDSQRRNAKLHRRLRAAATHVAEEADAERRMPIAA